MIVELEMAIGVRSGIAVMVTDAEKREKDEPSTK